jgi:hypothetical protein
MCVFSFRSISKHKSVSVARRENDSPNSQVILPNGQMIFAFVRICLLIPFINRKEIP